MSSLNRLGPHPKFHQKPNTKHWLTTIAVACYSPRNQSSPPGHHRYSSSPDRQQDITTSSGTTMLSTRTAAARPKSSPNTKPKRCAPISVFSPACQALPIRQGLRQQAETSFCAAAFTTHHLQCGKNADSTEDESRGTDRRMIGGMKPGIRQSAEDTGQQKQGPGKPRPKIPAEIDDEKTADGKVTEKMQRPGWRVRAVTDRHHSPSRILPA